MHFRAAWGLCRSLRTLAGLSYVPATSPDFRGPHLKMGVITCIIQRVVGSTELVGGPGKPRCPMPANAGHLDLGVARRCSPVPRVGDQREPIREGADYWLRGMRFSNTGGNIWASKDELMKQRTEYEVRDVGAQRTDVRSCDWATGDGDTVGDMPTLPTEELNLTIYSQLSKGPAEGHWQISRGELLRITRLQSQFTFLETQKRLGWA